MAGRSSCRARDRASFKCRAIRASPSATWSTRTACWSSSRRRRCWATCRSRSDSASLERRSGRDPVRAEFETLVAEGRGRPSRWRPRDRAGAAAGASPTATSRDPSARGPSRACTPHHAEVDRRGEAPRRAARGTDARHSARSGCFPRTASPRRSARSSTGSSGREPAPPVALRDSHRELRVETGRRADADRGRGTRTAPRGSDRPRFRSAGFPACAAADAPVRRPPPMNSSRCRWRTATQSATPDRRSLHPRGGDFPRGSSRPGRSRSRCTARREPEWVFRVPTTEPLPAKPGEFRIYSDDRPRPPNSPRSASRGRGSSRGSANGT